MQEEHVQEGQENCCFKIFTVYPIIADRMQTKEKHLYDFAFASHLPLLAVVITALGIPCPWKHRNVSDDVAGNYLSFFPFTRKGTHGLEAMVSTLLVLSNML